MSASSCRAAFTTRYCARSSCLGLADSAGNTELPLYVLNVTYPLIDEEIVRFCRGKSAVLIVEEGQPEYIEQHLNMVLHQSELRHQGRRARRCCRARASTPARCSSAAPRRS